MDQSASTGAMLTPDEQDLLAALRAGDDVAYARFVRQYTGPMLAVAWRILGNEHDARDAVQEGFISAFRAIESFQGGSRLSTWLHRIVVNAALMRLRSRRRTPEQPIEDLLPKFKEDGHLENRVAPWRRAPGRELERKEIKQVVRQSIDQLPDSYRTVLLLRDIEELSTQEVADILKINVNAVKTRLHRARMALRTLLDPHLREAVE